MNEPGPGNLARVVGSQAPKMQGFALRRWPPVPSAGDALTNHLWLDHRDKARSGTLRGERYDIEFRWDISNEMPGRKDTMTCTEYACTGGAFDFVHSISVLSVIIAQS